MQAWFAAVVEYPDPLFGNGSGDIKNQALTVCMTKVRSLTEAQIRK